MLIAVNVVRRTNRLSEVAVTTCSQAGSGLGAEWLFLIDRDSARFDRQPCKPEHRVPVCCQQRFCNHAVFVFGTQNVCYQETCHGLEIHSARGYFS